MTGEDMYPEASLDRSRARRRMMDRRTQGWPCCHDASQPARRAPRRLFCAVYWCSGWPYLDRTATGPGGRSLPFEPQQPVRSHSSSPLTSRAPGAAYSCSGRARAHGQIDNGRAVGWTPSARGWCEPAPLSKHLSGEGRIRRTGRQTEDGGGGSRAKGIHRCG